MDCGMDGELVRRLLAGDDDVERIEGEAKAAKDAGIDGVPCFVFDSAFVVSGAQSPDYLAQAIAHTAERQAQTTA
jgi:predicted DsbA family dithiol-disulfide isomerase